MPEPQPEPEPEPEQEPVPAEQVADSHKVGPVEVPRPGSWTIQVLERAVAERGNEFPESVEEWRYYVHFLRDYAGPDGELPASFDYLIEETFAALL